MSRSGDDRRESADGFSISIISGEDCYKRFGKRVAIQIAWGDHRGTLDPETAKELGHQLIAHAASVEARNREPDLFKPRL